MIQFNIPGQSGAPPAVSTSIIPLSALVQAGGTLPFPVSGLPFLSIANRTGHPLALQIAPQNVVSALTLFLDPGGTLEATFPFPVGLVTILDLTLPTPASNLGGVQPAGLGPLPLWGIGEQEGGVIVISGASSAVLLQRETPPPQPQMLIESYYATGAGPASLYSNQTTGGTTGIARLGLFEKVRAVNASNASFDVTLILPGTPALQSAFQIPPSDSALQPVVYEAEMLCHQVYATFSAAGQSISAWHQCSSTVRGIT